MEECLTPGNIILLAAAATIRLAQGATAEQLEMLSAFFNVIGDNLILLSLCAPSCADEEENSTSDE